MRDTDLMRWSNVGVIVRREVRDQMRDRRTLFVVVVLPILLYPVVLLGALQLAASFEQKPRHVVVVGAEALPAAPALLNTTRDGFDPGLFDAPAEAKLLTVTAEPRTSIWSHPQARRVGLRTGNADAVVLVPDDLGERIQATGAVELPIAYNSASEQSQMTYFRVREVVARWKDQIVTARLERDRKPSSYVEPVATRPEDVATREESGGSVWARFFPFLLVMMALMGAFYPAVDLCAGEKERGTMETLLISPASRAEIVVGKFLTVMLASFVTTFLNLASMVLTSVQIARNVGAMSPLAGGQGVPLSIAPPSLLSALWMVLLLIPLAALFSAVCLALAVLARSMREGQYYLTPLYLVALPLTFLSIAPGIELTPFYSLVPITGVSLLLRTLLQGDYGVARRYFVPVMVPTILYAVIALRWAIDQFQRESVLFREAERFDLRGWLRHLVRDREPAPSGGQALLCFVLMLSAAWFVMTAMSGSAVGLTPLGMIIGQVAFVLTPPVVMAFLLTSDPKRTLRLAWPSARHLAIGVTLAVALHPLVNLLRVVVEWLFPIPEAMRSQIAKLMANIPDLGTAVLVIALIPAVCEEVAFRGFILSGLRRSYRTLPAIVLSALLFGFLHVLLSLSQQLFNAALLGMVLGLLAIRSGSLLPGIAFHFINNGLALLEGWVAAEGSGSHRLVAWLYRDPGRGLYHWPLVALGAAVAGWLLIALVREGRYSKPSVVEAPGSPLADFG